MSNAGLIYPTAAGGSELIYTAPTHHQAHQATGHPYHHHPQDVQTEVPVMETSHPEVGYPFH